MQTADSNAVVSQKQGDAENALPSCAIVELISAILAIKAAMPDRPLAALIFCGDRAPNGAEPGDPGGASSCRVALCSTAQNPVVFPAALRNES